MTLVMETALCMSHLLSWLDPYIHRKLQLMLKNNRAGCRRQHAHMIAFQNKSLRGW